MSQLREGLYKKWIVCHREESLKSGGRTTIEYLKEKEGMRNLFPQEGITGSTSFIIDYAISSAIVRRRLKREVGAVVGMIEDLFESEIVLEVCSCDLVSNRRRIM